MQATSELSASERISLTNKRRDGAVNNTTTQQGAETRTNANTGTALLPFDLLSNYVSMGRSRIYALIDECKFPPPIKIGRSSRWLKSEIDSWITEQASARQTSQAGA
jgi:predicted DNA-binding transcriptional regulator AlpA